MVQKDPLEKEMTTTPVFLLGKSHRRRSLAGYSPWDHKGLDVTEHACKAKPTLSFRLTAPKLPGTEKRPNRSHIPYIYTYG